jgi:hypothetical protein
MESVMPRKSRIWECTESTAWAVNYVQRRKKSAFTGTNKNALRVYPSISTGLSR